MENTDKIEQEILEVVKSKILPESTLKEIKATIRKEIISRKYLSESDLQIHYVIERILKNIDPRIKSGIGGWLILPAISLITTPILSVIQLFVNLNFFREFLPELLNNPWFWMSVVINIVIVIFDIIVAFYFFQKRIIAIKLIIWFMVAEALSFLVQFVLLSWIFNEVDYKDLIPFIGACVYYAIWIRYFMRSKRVKNTFINSKKNKSFPVAIKGVGHQSKMKTVDCKSKNHASLNSNKKLLILLLLVIILIISSTFYWFSYRPSKIRQDCSWVRMTNHAIPEMPAITKEDVNSSKFEYDKCVEELAEKNKYKTGYKSIFTDGGIYCKDLLKRERSIIPAKPEEVWYRKVREKEYIFCIHEKGLKE